jgi:Na+/proline symporter
MLNLISIAHFFVTQVFPALFGLLFVRQFSAVRLIAGLIAGNAAVLVLHFSQANVSGINVGLIALLLNFLVAFAVSAVAKNDSFPRRWLRPLGRMNSELKGASHDAGRMYLNREDLYPR